MRLITLTDETGETIVERLVNPEDLETMSGVSLAALLLPEPTAEDIDTANEFLNHYQGSGS